jgi:coenzyme F420-reducing hydrogenase beta subunit
MIQINDKTKCCGCNACIQICPKKCISRIFDNEGFLYPCVHDEGCIGCGSCETVCPIKNPHIGTSARYKHPAAYAAYYKNEAVRIDSTSGGIWGALADKMLEGGAYISGAVFDKDFLVTHIITKEKSLMAEIRSSKYLQSDTRSLYSDVKKLLAIGERVFVCATPCQIAGLYKFLEKDYDNLYTVDLICKAVPSPKVFSAYLSCLEEKNESKIKSVKFKYKDKKHPWWFLSTRIDFENGRIYIRNAGYDSFMNSFLRTGLTVRPSCFECGFATYPRGGGGGNNPGGFLGQISIYTPY